MRKRRRLSKWSPAAVGLHRTEVEAKTREREQREDAVENRKDAVEKARKRKKQEIL